MSYLASFQELWSPETEMVPMDVTNWPSLTMALQEPLEAIQIWQETGTSIVRVTQSSIQWLERLYTFRERAEILWFLERHLFLILLLLEAYNKIGNYFPNSQVFLEVITDSDSLDEDQLVIFIAATLAADDAVNRLDQFDEDWWLDALDRSQGKLCINLELQSTTLPRKGEGL